MDLSISALFFFLPRYEIYYFTGDDMELYQTMIRWANIFSLNFIDSVIFIASPWMWLNFDADQVK